MKNSIIVLLLLFLTGCLQGCHWLTKAEEPSRIPIQANLLTKCPENLNEVQGVTGKAILEALLDDNDLYNECSARHNALVDAIEGDLK